MLLGNPFLDVFEWNDNFYATSTEQHSLCHNTGKKRREGNIVDTRQAATEQDKATLDVLSI